MVNMQRVSERISTLEDTVTDMLPSVAPAESRVAYRTLSADEQLQRFSAMTPQQYADMEQKYGSDEMGRYIDAMLTLSRQQRGGGQGGT